MPGDSPDPIDVRHVKISIMEGEPMGKLEAGGEDGLEFRLPVTIAVAQQDGLSLPRQSEKYVAIGCHRQPARIPKAAGEFIDAESASVLVRPARCWVPASSAMARWPDPAASILPRVWPPPR